MAAKLSIIIPHRGNGLGLWATIHSCESNLMRSGLDYNFVVVTNGEKKLPQDTYATVEQLKKTGRLLSHIHSEEPITPPVARQRGASAADGELLFFFDNHCLLEKQYFERAVMDYEKHGYGLLHSATVFHTGDGVHYHYRLTLDNNFWASSIKYLDNEYLPYQCAAGGHGGIVVPKKVWDDVGGYGPESLFKGYGGEELIFDLKLWMYGYKVMLDPRLIHYHYAGTRGYSRHFTDDYYVNLMVSAHVIGGEKWLYKVFHSFCDPTKSHLRLSGSSQRPWYDLLIEAYERSAQYAHEVAVRRDKDLDTLLAWFRANLIPY